MPIFTITLDIDADDVTTPTEAVDVIESALARAGHIVNITDYRSAE